MKRILAFLLSLFFIFISCQTVPITGRQQLQLVSTRELNTMSFKSYSEFLSKHKVVEDTQQALMVKKVGKDIQTAVEQYFTQKNASAHLQGYAWEFNTVEDDAVNAWCMPGGKVVVYTGIMPIAKDENGLAVVMGHEIAHAVANHGNERMSQGLILQMGGMALSTALSQKPQQTQNLFLAVYGLGATVGVMLPFSRLHESEADRLGLIFMSMAGYDPNAAVSFWQRMADKKKGAKIPEFLSTHPSDEARINNIKTLIPEAMNYYRK